MPWIAVQYARPAAFGKSKFVGQRFEGGLGGLVSLERLAGVCHNDRMARSHLVRIGAMGHVGRFTALDGTLYPRAARVIVRSARGLEVGEVLAGPAARMAEAPADGPILRGMTAQDELLEARLQKNRQAAYEACCQRLADERLPAVLLDVEHLFDGQTLVFHFLGDVPREVEALTAELAEAYDAKAQFRAFVNAATVGCGPGCGTDEAAGCGSCSTGCAVAGACATRRH